MPIFYLFLIFLSGQIANASRPQALINVHTRPLAREDICFICTKSAGTAHTGAICPSCLHTTLDANADLITQLCPVCLRTFNYTNIITSIPQLLPARSTSRSYNENDVLIQFVVDNTIKHNKTGIFVFLLNMNEASLRSFLMYCQNTLSFDNDDVQILVGIIKQILDKWACYNRLSYDQILSLPNTAIVNGITTSNGSDREASKRSFLYRKAMGILQEKGIEGGSTKAIVKKLRAFFGDRTITDPMEKELLYSVALRLLDRLDKETHVELGNLLRNSISSLDDLNSPLIVYIDGYLCNNYEIPSIVLWKLAKIVFEPNDCKYNLDFVDNGVSFSKLAFNLYNFSECIIRILASLNPRSARGHKDRFQSIMRALYKKCCPNRILLTNIVNFYEITKGHECLKELHYSISQEIKNLMENRTVSELLESLEFANLINKEDIYDKILMRINGPVCFQTFKLMIAHMSKELTAKSSLIYKLLDRKLVTPDVHKDYICNYSLFPDSRSIFFEVYIHGYALYITRKYSITGKFDDVKKYIDVYLDCLDLYSKKLSAIWSSNAVYVSTCHLYGMHTIIRDIIRKYPKYMRSRNVNFILGSTGFAAPDSKKVNGVAVKAIDYPTLDPRESLCKDVCMLLAEHSLQAYIPWIRESARNSLCSIIGYMTDESYYEDGKLNECKSHCDIRRTDGDDAATIARKLMRHTLFTTTSHLVGLLLKNKVKLADIHKYYLNGEDVLGKEVILYGVRYLCMNKALATNSLPSNVRIVDGNVIREQILADSDEFLKYKNSVLRTMNNMMGKFWEEHLVSLHLIKDATRIRKIFVSLIDHLIALDFNEAMSRFGTVTAGKIVDATRSILEAYWSATHGNPKQKKKLNEGTYLRLLQEILTDEEIIAENSH